MYQGIARKVRYAFRTWKAIPQGRFDTQVLKQGSSIIGRYKKHAADHKNHILDDCGMGLLLSSPKEDGYYLEARQKIQKHEYSSEPTGFIPVQTQTQPIYSYSPQSNGP